MMILQSITKIVIENAPYYNLFSINIFVHNIFWLQIVTKYGTKTYYNTRHKKSEKSIFYLIETKPGQYIFYIKC